MLISSFLFFQKHSNEIEVQRILVINLLTAVIIAIHIPNFVRGLTGALGLAKYIGDVHIYWIADALKQFVFFSTDINDIFVLLVLFISVLSLWSLVKTEKLVYRRFFFKTVFGLLLFPVLLSFLASYISPIFKTRNLWVGALFPIIGITAFSEVFARKYIVTNLAIFFFILIAHICFISKN